VLCGVASGIGRSQNARIPSESKRRQKKFLARGGEPTKHKECGVDGAVVVYYPRDAVASRTSQKSGFVPHHFRANGGHTLRNVSRRHTVKDLICRMQRIETKEQVAGAKAQLGRERGGGESEKGDDTNAGQSFKDG